MTEQFTPLANIAGIASPLVGAGLVLWFIKRGFNQLDQANRSIGKRLDSIERTQQAMQVSVARDCTTRAESEKILDRIDDHETRISRLEAMKQR